MNIVVRINFSSKLKKSSSEIGYYSYTNRYLPFKKNSSMKQSIIFFITCLFVIGCASTNKIYNDITTFQLKKISAKEIHKIENNQNGIEKVSNVTIRQGYFPELDIYEFSQPKIYNRKIGNINTAVSYYFTEKDSVVRVISYAWNEQDDNYSIQGIFDTNKKLFTDFFKNNGDVKRTDEPTYWQDAITWENKKILVFQFILGNDKGAYRTRTIIKYK